MASLFLLLFRPLFFILLLLAVTVTESKGYSEIVLFPRHDKPENFTHLHFYFHDIVSGENTTAVRVITSPFTNPSPTTFGLVAICDNPLTEGPDLSSEHVGRAQGLYASTDMKVFSLMMAFNFVFTEGEFNGSIVVMYGRSSLALKVRELAIIRGTGSFRFAIGYAHAKACKFTSVVAVIEYDLYIWHWFIFIAKLVLV